jgi:hypothetical protein
MARTIACVSDEDQRILIRGRSSEIRMHQAHRLVIDPMPYKQLMKQIDMCLSKPAE